MSEKALEVQNLEVAFDATAPVVSNVSFSIAQGECLAVVGESGSGKSLTSLAIMGLLPNTAATRGAVYFGGKNLLDQHPSDWRSFRGQTGAMVFQEPMTSLNPLVRCGRQVSEHLSLKKAEARKHVLQLFQEVELPDPERIHDAYPHALSGGQKQRVMLAMAMAADPQLLIADEPTTALDATVQRSVLKLISRLQKDRNMSVLFVSHDLAVVRELADKVAVMYKGELVEIGPTASLLEQPKHPYTKALLACRPPLTGRPFPLPTATQILAGNPPKATEELTNERKQRLEKLWGQAPVMRLQGLTKTYRTKTGAVQAVKNVNLELYPGEVLGLVGESGCGKSSLSRCVIGLESYGGQVQILGEERSTDRKLMARKIQLVFQDPFSSLPPHKTVGNLLSEVLQVHEPGLKKSARKARILSLLIEVGLAEDAFDRHVHAFSGGQRQRIVIARALLPNPKVLICDESVSALDVSVQSQILNLLCELKEGRGLSLLFISHDLSVVRYISDRIAVMQEGDVVEVQEADALFATPKSAYTQSLLGAIPRW